MSSKNLWGDLGSLAKIKTPVVFLKEQANQLTQATQGTLRGRVSQFGQGDQIEADLEVVAPALGDYSYTILKIRHSLDVYPVKVFDASTHMIEREADLCYDEKSFLESLESILSSDGVRKVISTLLSQCRE